MVISERTDALRQNFKIDIDIEATLFRRSSFSFSKLKMKVRELLTFRPGTISSEILIAELSMLLLKFNCSHLIKHILAPLITVIIFSCETKNTEQSLSEKKVTRQIKELRESTHEPFIKAGKIEYRSKIAEFSFLTSSVFNEKGQLIKESRFNSKGNLEWKAINKYDVHGNVIERDVYNPVGYLLSKKISAFDAKGKLIGSKEFDADENLLSKETSSFDSDGNQILVTYKLTKGNSIKTVERVFDQRNRNIENSYFTNGSLESKDIRGYDSIENCIEFTEFYPLRNEQNTIRYRYDKQNNKIEEVSSRNNLVTSRSLSRYDKKNNLVETSTYGVMGNLITQQKHQYQYDDEGQWIRQIIMINNNPTSVILHEIEYY